MKLKKLNFLNRLNHAIENGHVLDWKKFKNLKEENLFGGDLNYEIFSEVF